MRNALIDLTPLRASPQFRRLWAGQALSGVGTQMTFVAVLFQVWRATHSTVWTGGVGVAQAAPIIALSLFAGAMIDAGDPRRLYLIATAGQVACSVLLAVQGFLGHAPVVGVLVLVGLQSCFVAGSGPASRTFISASLPLPQRAAGLALNRIAFQAALLAGPALGGLVLAGFGGSGCYLLDAVTFAGALYGALGLPPVPARLGRSAAGARSALEGLSFLLRHRAVRSALLIDLAVTVLAMPISLFPLINAERFGDNPRTLGLFLTAIAAGGVLASVFSGVVSRRARAGVVMLAGAATWGIALALFGVLASPWLGLCCLLVAGVADTLTVVSRGTIIQTQVPRDMLGRVSAAEQIVGIAGPDLGNLRAGLVAGLTSGATALVSGGLLCVAGAAIVGLTTPELRRAQRAGVPEPGPPTPEVLMSRNSSRRAHSRTSTNGRTPTCSSAASSPR